MYALNRTSTVFHLHRRKCAVSLTASSSWKWLSVSTHQFNHIFYPFIILLILSANQYNGKSIMVCDALPTSLVLPPSQSSSLSLLPTGINIIERGTTLQQNGIDGTVAASVVAAQTNNVLNLTRQHGGDVFNAIDTSRCDMDTCVGLSSGTAGVYKPNIKETDTLGKYKTNTDDCKCQCLPHLESFREDLNICVDDIHECTLAPFVSGSTSEKIPFVFLPLRGQIIHPSKEISFQGIKKPICAVSGSQYLTSTGWTELRNPIDLDVPFRLFRDEGRTFLQWLGESDLRYKMQGRLILVHLMCRDMAPLTRESIMVVDNNDTAGHPVIKPMKTVRNLFSPCVAIRVVGMPIKQTNNVTEVSFQSEATLSSITSIEGLTAKEYIAIAVCSLILGLIYVASVFLYIHVKRYKSRMSNAGNATENVAGKSDFPPNDEVTFGNGFNRGNYDRSSSSANGLADRHKNSNRNLLLNGLGNEEHGVVKSNPLLNHYPNLSDNSGFVSDMSNSNSECDDERAISHEMLKNMQSAAHIHNANNSQRRDRNENSPSATQETECLPEENVSITEDMTTEDKLENMKAIVSGTMRRKLYFNPAYFEPHLLLSPPPAAIEFLSKIREVITLAKYKMATKRFQPSLIMIPEEHAINKNSETCKNHLNNSTTNSLKQEDSRKKSCSGCPGCSANDKTEANPSNCKNCGDKRNSIRKWLEGVSKHENEIITGGEQDAKDENDGSNCVRHESNSRELNVKTNDSSSSSDTDTVKANSIGSKGSKKRQAPPIPSTAPKIISHYLKRENVLSRNKNEIGNSHEIYSKLTNLNDRHPANASIYEKSDIYNNLSIAGSEIYNNPQFMQNSPPLSHRSRTSKHSHTSRSCKKPLEVLDQYSNPSQLRHEAMMKNLQGMPDMVYEAIANDYTKRNSDKINQNLYGHINLPTPDYDDPCSTNSRKRNNYERANEDAFIPPPDYNTIGRRQYQPDSPIYHRKSPHHLIVDYETDSLERTNTNKTNRHSLTPHSNNSSDLSSQPSPSLSSALPLEEEVEIGNTVYDRVEGYRKDGDPIKTINIMPKVHSNKSIYEDIGSVANAYLQSRRSSLPSKEPRIKYNTPFHGSMTIEVEHQPTDEEVSTDSDQFEPDTLDRKPKKMNNVTKQTNDRLNNIPNNQRNISAWPNRKQMQPEYLNQSNNNNMHSSLENLNSLPDMHLLQNNNVENQVVLRSSGSFKSNSLGNYLSEIGAFVNDSNLEKNFSSLREIYEAKNQKNLLQRPSVTEVDFDGRLLTLEARHSKRQRQTTLEKSIKKELPPDIIPFENNNIYDIPTKLESVKNNEKVLQKNLTGWNTDDANIKNNNKNNSKKRNDTNEEQILSESVSSSSNSENTEITGVSDTHANSEHDSVKRAYSQVRKISVGKSSKLCNQHSSQTDMEIKQNYMNLGDLRCMRNEQSDCNSDSSTLKTGSTKFYYKSNLNQQANLKSHMTNHSIDDLDKIEILSSKSLKTKEMDLPMIVDSTTKDLIAELANDTSSFTPHLAHMGPTKVFHVDVSSPTNGMQIALGIRDRVKKSKDLKNAWKKFVNLATSKFQGSTTTSPSSKPNVKGEYDLESSALSDTTDKDDGISSLNTCDDNMTVSSSDTRGNVEVLSRTPSSSSSDTVQKQNKNEMDYGYISADSNESRALQKKLYERFNFKAAKNAQDPCSSKSILTDAECISKNINRMQDIKENSESDRNSVSSVKCDKSIFKETAAKFNGMPPTAKLIDYVPKNMPLFTTDALNVKVYSSSDDDRYSSGMSSESDEEYNLDELCESGAESVETHSVLFKNIRKSTEGNAKE